MTPDLEIIPLGGIGKFGMNCTALRYGNQMILIDAGARFPGGSSGMDLGINIVVPDISFLKENKNQLKAILLTHGHEDHAGGIPYIINEIPLPIYGTSLTLGLVSARLKEHGLYQTVTLNHIESHKSFRIGPFEIEPLHITHSFPDALCFSISTPVGRIIWTGDFKLDPKPIDNKLTDVQRLSDYGKKGVLALFSDSTNSEVPGSAPSESTAYELLRILFRKAEKKIIISCFASSIHRIQIILDLAQEFDRKVVALGRSMVSNIRIASQLKYLHFPDDVLLSKNQALKLPDHQLIVLASGSQGEPMAAMNRIAIGAMKNITVQRGDTAIISSRIIPGNEKAISNMIDQFHCNDAFVFDSHHSSVHVSGHGLRDDLKKMVDLTKPKFFIPIHGQLRQLKTHASLAYNQGIPLKQIHIIENGDVLKISQDSAQVSEKTHTGERFIDDGILGEVHQTVLQDRLHLSRNGFLSVILQIDMTNNKLTGTPKLISRGFISGDTSEKILEIAQNEIVKLAQISVEKKHKNNDIIKEDIIKYLKSFIRKKTGKRPIIIPIIIEILP